MTNSTCYVKEEAFQSNNLTKWQISLPQALGLAFSLSTVDTSRTKMFHLPKEGNILRAVRTYCLFLPKNIIYGRNRICILCSYYSVVKPRSGTDEYPKSSTCVSLVWNTFEGFSAMVFINWCFPYIFWRSFCQH